VNRVLVIETSRAVAVIDPPGTLGQWRAAITALSDSGVPPTAQIKATSYGPLPDAERRIELIAEWSPDGLREVEADADAGLSDSG
jgi:hypothetical protein